MLFRVTSFLGKQGIAFRGHSENEASQNKGNFLECMSLLTKFDPFLKQYNMPSNATYLSNVSQNEMIQCCAEEVTESIVTELKESRMYAIMSDEARDNNSELLSVCVRYVSPENGDVKEDFLDFNDLEGFKADTITQSLENTFSGINSKIMSGIQACIPKSENFLSEEYLSEMPTHYHIKLCSEELVVAKKYLSHKNAPDTQAVYKLLDPHVPFPETDCSGCTNNTSLQLQL